MVIEFRSKAIVLNISTTFKQDKTGQSDRLNILYIICLKSNYVSLIQCCLSNFTISAAPNH